jgi:hypothetical protein
MVRERVDASAGAVEGAPGRLELARMEAAARRQEGQPDGEELRPAPAHGRIRAR